LPATGPMATTAPAREAPMDATPPLRDTCPDKTASSRATESQTSAVSPSDGKKKLPAKKGAKKHGKKGRKTGTGVSGRQQTPSADQDVSGGQQTVSANRSGSGLQQEPPAHGDVRGSSQVAASQSQGRGAKATAGGNSGKSPTFHELAKANEQAQHAVVASGDSISHLPDGMKSVQLPASSTSLEGVLTIKAAAPVVRSLDPEPPAEEATSTRPLPVVQLPPATAAPRSAQVSPVISIVPIVSSRPVQLSIPGSQTSLPSASTLATEVRRGGKVAAQSLEDGQAIYASVLSGHNTKTSSNKDNKQEPPAKPGS
jgi:hypothetical protein